MQKGDVSHRESELRWAAHATVHELIAEALNKAENAASAAIDKAASAQAAALRAALEDHHREHQVHDVAHDREHQASAEAIRVADIAMTQRLAGLNEFREQLREQARSFASTERVDAVTRELDRRLGDSQTLSNNRYEILLQRLDKVERADIAKDSKSLGQGTVIAAIVSAIVVAGIVIGIIANLSKVVP